MNDNPSPKRAGASRVEDEAERQRRLGRESDRADPATLERRRRMTQEALADVDAGRLIDEAAMHAWAESLGSERELPPPQPR